MCYMTVSVFEFRPRAWFCRKSPVCPLLKCLVPHCVSRVHELISFGWTCTRTLSYSRSGCFSCMDSAFRPRPGLVWVKASWNMNNGNVGSSALIDLTWKSMPVELHYLLMWIQIYKPSKENHAATIYVTHKKPLQILHENTDEPQE